MMQAKLLLALVATLAPIVGAVPLPALAGTLATV